jgi:pyruvate/2-oxoglutarate/acetoin dehydrogenase E1 component
VIRLTLSNDQALAVLAALETWQAEQPLEALEAPIGRLTTAGIASPYRSALEALEARHGPF